MLRAILVGLLAVSATSCKSSGDSAKAQPGAAAGRVVEVSGTVTVRHDNAAQPLVKGATVESDDIIETGADGNVIIELTHNLVRWELGANKKSKVRESAAWGLARKQGDVAIVQQDAAAAGRPAERSAADTAVSAQAEGAAPGSPAPAPPEQSPRAEAPPKKLVPPSATTTTRERAPESDKLEEPSSGGGAPPPPKVLAKASRGVEVGGRGSAQASADAPGGGAMGGGATGDANATARPDTPPAPKPGGQAMSPADADKAAMDVVLENEKTLKACLTKDAQAVSVTIKVAANGKASAVVSGKAPVPTSVQSCVKRSVANMKFAAVATTVKVEVAR